MTAVVALSLFAVGINGSQAGTLRTTDVPFRQDIRALGMGGAYVAAGKNGSAFLYNPALLNQSFTDISLATGFGFDENVFKMVDFIRDHKNALDTFTSLTTAEQNKVFRDLSKIDGERIRFRFAPMLNFVVHNFGIAAYGVVRGGAGVDKGIFEPRILADGTGDAVVAIGIAKSISPKMAFGVTTKIINSRTAEFRIPISRIGNFDGGSVIDSLKSGSTGVGFDVGVLYRLSERTNLGASIQDLYGKVGSSKYPMNVKVGFAWTAKRLTIAADLTDLLNRDGVSIFNRAYMGTEFRIPFLSLRAGFYQGYLSYGAGLNFKIIKLDVAKYKIERSGRPGVDGLGQLAAQIKIGIGW